MLIKGLEFSRFSRFLWGLLESSGLFASKRVTSASWDCAFPLLVLQNPQPHEFENPWMSSLLAFLLVLRSASERTSGGFSTLLGLLSGSFFKDFLRVPKVPAAFWKPMYLQNLRLQHETPETPL